MITESLPVPESLKGIRGFRGMDFNPKRPRFGYSEVWLSLTITTGGVRELLYFATG